MVVAECWELSLLSLGQRMCCWWAAQDSLCHWYSVDLVVFVMVQLSETETRSEDCRSRSPAAILLRAPPVPSALRPRPCRASAGRGEWRPEEYPSCSWDTALSRTSQETTGCTWSSTKSCSTASSERPSAASHTGDI